MAVPVVVGRGKMYVGAYTGAEMDVPPVGGATTAVGNCKEIQYTVEEDLIEHKDYQTELRTVDEQLTLELRYNGTFTTDYITTENLCRFIGGDVSNGTIRALTSMKTRYQLKFAQDNARGENKIYIFKKVKLSPGGSFALIGDDWQQMQFKFQGLKDTANYPTSPFFDILPTSSTSSTSTTTSTS